MTPKTLPSWVSVVGETVPTNTLKIEKAPVELTKETVFLVWSALVASDSWCNKAIKEIQYRTKKFNWSGEEIPSILKKAA